MPWAPRRIALVIARFIARRNMMRFCSCWEIESAISCASTSGLRTSSMLTCTGTPSIRCSSPLSDSMSSPFLPITTPGRALCTVMRAFFAGRSITTRETAACASFFLRKSRTLMSSSSMVEKFLLLAYHFEAQLRFNASRKPIGLIFWPMALFSPVADGDDDVAGRFHDARATALGLGTKATQKGTALDADVRDLQLVDVGAVVVLGVGDRGLQQVADDHRALLGRELQYVECLLYRFTADEVRHQPALLGRKADATQFGSRIHWASLRLGRCCRRGS